MSKKIFFVDDDSRAGSLFKRFCRARPFDVETFTEPKKALDAVKKSPPALLVTDLKMPGMTGIELLQAVREMDDSLPVIIATGYSSVENAVEALRLGATDFLRKPYDMDELLHQIEQLLEHQALQEENRHLRRELARSGVASKMIGESEAAEKLRKMVAKISGYRCNIIIEGESGTGKELVARDLHSLGDNADRPFVVIDCGALTDTLLETELFGHEKGAFTGADRQRKGRLEEASGGTLFLDEIGNISDAMQTKLLRVIQEQTLSRVGGSEELPIDVQFMAASNRNLPAMVEDGDFRHDLYHRLNVVSLYVPPLRSRKEDIPLLISHFISVFNKKHGELIERFSDAAMKQLLEYSWPGNIRELRNLVERHIILADGKVMELVGELGTERAPEDLTTLLEGQPDLRTLERRYIEHVLSSVSGNKETAAAILGINKSTLWRKLQQYEDL